jgi:hypothetical protein
VARPCLDSSRLHQSGSRSDGLSAARAAARKRCCGVTRHTWGLGGTARIVCRVYLFVMNLVTSVPRCEVAAARIIIRIYQSDTDSFTSHSVIQTKRFFRYRCAGTQHGQPTSFGSVLRSLRRARNWLYWQEASDRVGRADKYRGLNQHRSKGGERQTMLLLEMEKEERK